jgi:TP901 family phage tail tape measure protein
MNARTVEIVFLGNTKDLEAAEVRSAVGAKGTGDAIAEGFNSGTTRAGNALEKLGKKGEQLGIPFASGLTTAGKHLDEASTKTGKLTSVMGELGKATLLAGGAIAVGFGVEAVKAGSQYESAQAKIQGATQQTTKEVKALTSTFGGTAGKFESSGEEMESAFAGVSGQLQATEGHALGTAEAMNVMRSATDLNTAVQGNLAETTSSLSAVMQAFHLSTGQAAGAADTLYNVSTRLDVPIGSLATAMDKLHSRLGVLAPSLGETGGLMVALGEHGVTGSRGVQVVTSGLTKLVGGSEKTTEVLDDLGVHIFNAQGKFIGIQGVIAQLGPKLDELTPKQRLFAEQTLFGAGANQVLGSVMQSGVSAYQKATDEATKTGTAQQAAAKQAQTLRGEFETAKSALESFAGVIGLAVMPELKLMGTGLSEGVGWLTKHKDAALALGLVISGPLAAAVSVYATQKAVAFARSTQEMVVGIGKFGAKVAEVVPQVIAKFTAQTGAAAAAAATEESIYGDVDAALAESTGQRVAAARTIEASIYGEASAYEKAAIAVESADSAMADADAGLATANEAVGASFTAMLGPIGLVGAALIAAYGTIKGVEAGLKAITGEASNVDELLGGNQPGESAREGMGTKSAYNLKSGLTHQKGEFQGRGVLGEGASSIEQQIIKFWESKGFSPAGAAGFVGNAKLESSLTPGAAGGGLYQQSGLGPEGAEEVAKGNVTQQSEEVLRRLSSSQIAKLKAAKNPAEAARLIESEFEVPAGSRPGEQGYGTAEEGTAHLRQREQAAIEAYERSGGGNGAGGGSNTGLAGLMNETSNAKGVKEAERAKEKAESKAESAAKKAEDEAKRQLEKITTGGESLLKKYEAEVQNSTPSAMEKALGISTTGRFKSIPGMAERAAGTGRLGGLEGELGKSAAASESGKQESKLVTELKATHQAGLVKLADELAAAHKQALDTLAAEMVATEQLKLGESLKIQATEEKDRTTQLEHTATDQLNIVKAEQAQQTNAMKAAATAIGDATQSMSDSFSALAQSIEDQSKVMSDSSNAVVEGIKDQTNIEVSVLGERGLYGLNLVAQKEEVQLDQMKASYDQQIQQARIAEDQLTAQWQGVLAADQQTVDLDKAQADAQEAKAQAHSDAMTLLGAQNIASAQAEVDAVQLAQDQKIGNAELKVLAAANKSKEQQSLAAAGLKYAEGEGEKQEALATSRLKTVELGAASMSEEAARAMENVSNFWNEAIKNAEKAMAHAKGESAVALANASQALTSIEDKAQQEEARVEKEVATTKARASTQYAGSGLTVNQYGIDFDNAESNAAAIGWELRGQSVP